MGTETVMEPQCTGKVGEDCHDETITKCQDISIKKCHKCKPEFVKSDIQEANCATKHNEMSLQIKCGS